jgi:hypothetical protein
MFSTTSALGDRLIWTDFLTDVQADIAQPVLSPDQFESARTADIYREIFSVGAAII